MEIYITDGGRQADGFIQEKLDCTVRAVALARRISYKDAHKQLEIAGRKTGHRFNFMSWINSVSWAKCCFLLGVDERQTVRQFVNNCPNAIYIVQIRGHVFALNHGQILDTFKFGLKSRVLRAWIITLDK